MRRHFIQTALLGCVLALAGGGCSVIPKQNMAPQALPENEIEVSNFAHTIDFGGQSNTLTAGQQAAIGNFLYSNGVGYGDELVLDFHPDDVAWQAKMAAVNAYLKTRGIWVWNATVSGEVSNPQTASLEVRRFTVLTPDCYAESREPYYRTQDARWPTFGCTTAQNLGVLVASPKDLIDPKPDSGPHAYYATRAIQMYRAFYGRLALETAPTTSAADIRVISPSAALQEIGENSGGS